MSARRPVWQQVLVTSMLVWGLLLRQAREQGYLAFLGLERPCRSGLRSG